METITLEIAGRTERFDSIETAAMHLLALSDRTRETEERDRYRERCLTMGGLLQARTFWRKTLAAYQEACDRGYADPATVVRKTGHAAFHSEPDTLNILAQLNAKIARLQTLLFVHTPAPAPREGVTP